MDELDGKIISILQTNGRSSNARIARNVGVSEGTVRRRLKRLVEDAIISIVAIPDPSKIGYKSEALIGVQVEPDKIDQVADSLAQLAPVYWVAMTTGAYDIFATVALSSAEELGLFLRSKIGIIPGVRRTETFVTLEVKKRNFGVLL